MKSVYASDVRFSSDAAEPAGEAHAGPADVGPALGGLAGEGGAVDLEPDVGEQDHLVARRADEYAIGEPDRRQRPGGRRGGWGLRGGVRAGPSIVRLLLGARRCGERDRTGTDGG